MNERCNQCEMLDSNECYKIYDDADYCPIIGERLAQTNCNECEEYYEDY